MRSFIIGLFLGIIVGGGGLWFHQQARHQPIPTAHEVRKHMDAKLETLELQAYRIQQEMAEKGQVVRRKASALGETVADAAADARITAAIKAKLAAEPDLSALAISVATTDGVVTLSGEVARPELVGNAMVLALETDGAREVISTLQVRKK